jgi:hypothetical protein
MTSSSTVPSGVPFIPWSTGYDARSFTEPTTAAYGARTYFPQEAYTTPDVYIHDGGPWPQQLLPTQLTPGYGIYDQGATVGYNSNQEMRRRFAWAFLFFFSAILIFTCSRDRNQAFRGSNNAQDDEVQEWYDGP